MWSPDFRLSLWHRGTSKWVRKSLAGTAYNSYGCSPDTVVKKKIFHLDPFKKRNLFYSLVPFLCRNFTAAGSIIHSHVPASLIFPMWKSLETESPKFQIKQCQIFRRTMRTLLQDLAEKSLKGLGTKARTNWEDRSANSLAYQVSNHSIFLCTGCLSLEFSSDGSHFAPLQRILLCLRTSGWCTHGWYFYDRTCMVICISAVIFTHCQSDASSLPFWGSHQHLKLCRYSPYLSSGATDTPQQRRDK